MCWPIRIAVRTSGSVGAHNGLIGPFNRALEDPLEPYRSLWGPFSPWHPIVSGGCGDEQFFPGGFEDESIF